LTATAVARLQDWEGGRRPLPGPRRRWGAASGRVRRGLT